MEIVEKVLVGKVNKQIVSKIKSNGGVSIGLSGRDHQLLKVKKGEITQKRYRFRKSWGNNKG